MSLVLRAKMASTDDAREPESMIYVRSATNPDEWIRIGVKHANGSGGQVRLVFDAPQAVQIVRGEWLAKHGIDPEVWLQGGPDAIERAAS